MSCLRNEWNLMCWVQKEWETGETGGRGYQGSCASVTDHRHYLECDEKSPQAVPWDWCRQPFGGTPLASWPWRAYGLEQEEKMEAEREFGGKHSHWEVRRWRPGLDRGHGDGRKGNQRQTFRGGPHKNGARFPMLTNAVPWSKAQVEIRQMNRLRLGRWWRADKETRSSFSQL